MSITGGAYRLLSSSGQCMYCCQLLQSACHWHSVQPLHLHIRHYNPAAGLRPWQIIRVTEAYKNSAVCLLSSPRQCTAGVPVCPPWGITVQLSTCASAGTAPLPASGLRRAAAQSLSATSTAYSSIVVIGTPLQGSTACADSGPDTVGRHLLAVEPDLDAVPEEATGYWLAMQTTGLGEDVSRSLQSLSIITGNTEDHARQLMQIGNPAMATGSQSFGPEHYQVRPRALQCQDGPLYDWM